MASRAGSEPTSQEADLARLYVDAYLAPNLVLGQEAALRVVLAAKPRQKGALELELIPQGRTWLTLSTSGPAVEIGPEPRRRLYVPLEGDAAPAYFYLRAWEPGDLVVTLTFTLGGQVVGQTQLQAQVVAAAGSKPRFPESPVQALFASEATVAPVPAEVTFGMQPPDITLYVRAQGQDPPLYEFRVYTDRSDLAPTSNVWGEEWALRLPTSAQALLDAAWERARNGHSPCPDPGTPSPVGALGWYLYEALFPEGAKRWYWERVHPAAKGSRLTLALITDDACLPWEMVRPYRVDDRGLEEADFLCQQFVTSRWLPGAPPPPDAVPVSRVTIVVPPTKTAAQFDEKRYLLELEGRLRGLTVNLAYDPEHVRDLLAAGEASVLHFITAPPSLGGLHEGGWTSQEAALERVRPLVYLSVHARREGEVQLTGLGTWARRFIDAGCSACVGPLWAVEDELALAFAVEFYERLWEGGTLHRSLELARARVRDLAPHDPAWLAYVLYGQPLAKVYLPRPSPGYAVAQFRDLAPDAAVEAGEQYQLEVNIQGDAPSWYRGRTADTRKGATQAAIDVLVTGAGFKVHPARERLPVGGTEPKPVTFDVVPYRPGRRSLVIQFWQGKNYLDALELPVDVR